MQLKRSFRIPTFAGVITLMLLANSLFLCWSVFTYRLNMSSKSTNHHRHDSTEAFITEAGNSTLGFSSIFILNMKARYDRLDAISLQAFLSGVKITEYPAVEQDAIHDKGLPPTRSPGYLNKGQIGCWRAHANIWATIIRENLPPVLILESDAAWDVKIREIMPNLNRNFRRLLNDIGSSALPNPGRWAYDDDSNTNVAEDTWMSNHWDVFSVGHCHEDRDGYNSTIFYDDAYVPPTAQYGDRTISHQRVILKSKSIGCTAGYTISQTGAAKLLLKTNINLDQPVDLIIQDMIWNGELVAYHMYPPVVSQWRYVPDIGMDEANSDIKRIDPAAEGTEESWAEANRTHNVWTLWYNPANSFDELALLGAGKRILGYELPKN